MTATQPNQTPNQSTPASLGTPAEEAKNNIDLLEKIKNAEDALFQKLDALADPETGHPASAYKCLFTRAQIMAIAEVNHRRAPVALSDVLRSVGL